jgi:hypothetical protein
MAIINVVGNVSNKSTVSSYDSKDSNLLKEVLSKRSYNIIIFWVSPLRNRLISFTSFVARIIAFLSNTSNLVKDTVDLL